MLLKVIFLRSLRSASGCLPLLDKLCSVVRPSDSPFSIFSMISNRPSVKCSAGTLASSQSRIIFLFFFFILLYILLSFSRINAEITCSKPKFYLKLVSIYCKLAYPKTKVQKQTFITFLRPSLSKFLLLLLLAFDILSKIWSKYSEIISLV